MISDTDRREVARRLRELGKLAYSPDNTYELMADALSVDDFEGTDELFSRLADLIDPECRHEEFCRVCGHMIPDGWSECPRCRSKVVRDDNR